MNFYLLSHTMHVLEYFKPDYSKMNTGSIVCLSRLKPSIIIKGKGIEKHQGLPTAKELSGMIKLEQTCGLKWVCMLAKIVSFLWGLKGSVGKSSHDFSQPVHLCRLTWVFAADMFLYIHFAAHQLILCFIITIRQWIESKTESTKSIISHFVTPK